MMAIWRLFSEEGWRKLFSWNLRRVMILYFFLFHWYLMSPLYNVPTINLRGEFEIQLLLAKFSCVHLLYWFLHFWFKLVVVHFVESFGLLLHGFCCFVQVFVRCCKKVDGVGTSFSHGLDFGSLAWTLNNSKWAFHGIWPTRHL